MLKEDGALPEKQTVYPAEPKRYNAMGSFGKASYMLIRQHQFPHTYSQQDEIISADSDRCFQWDHDHARRCFNQHTGGGQLDLQRWVEDATPEEVIAFLADLLKAGPASRWSGFRVLGTVNRGNGYAVWTLQLFRKHPESTTEVFTGESAPNILDRPR